MNYKIIQSNSKGNAVLIENILIDCGVPFKKINEAIDLSKVEVVLITHQHGDHLNIRTLKAIMKKNKKIRVYANKSVAHMLTHPDILTSSEMQRSYFLGLGYTLISGHMNIEPVKLYHDVENYGWRIETLYTQNNYSIFYATDTHTLEGIEAKDYDYYFIETNYTEENLNSFDRDRVVNVHLSKEQAHNFFITNKKESSVLIPLHKSERNY